jgi:hypothetical protein
LIEGALWGRVLDLEQKEEEEGEEEKEDGEQDLGTDRKLDGFKN